MARRPEKREGAFRTIREVADWLGVPTHVLRFWESKFDKVTPVKGAGGRRYYRPEDMRLLGGIKVLLHDQGQTIRGVAQKIADEGIDPVCALSPELETPGATSGRSRKVIRKDKEAEPQVVPFERTAPADPVETDQPDAPDVVETAEPEPVAAEAAPSDSVDDTSQPDVLDAVAADAPLPIDGSPDGIEPLEDLATADADAPVDVPDDAGDAASDEPASVEPVAAASLELPPVDGAALPPSVVALRLVSSSQGCSDPRRLRRLARRLRGLADEIADDLAS